MKAPWANATSPPSAMLAPAPDPGEYITAAYSSTTSATYSTLGAGYFTPIDLAEAQSFAGIATNLSGTVAAGGTTPLIRLGVYASAASRRKPVGTTSLAEVSIDPTTGVGERYAAFGSALTLGPGRYWLAWMLVSGSAMTTSPTATALNILPPITLPSGLLGNANYHGFFFQAGTNAAALPDVTSIANRQSSPLPMTALRAA